MGTTLRNASNKGNLGVEDAWAALSQRPLFPWFASKKDGRARAHGPLPALCDKAVAAWVISWDLPIDNTVPLLLVAEY